MPRHGLCTLTALLLLSTGLASAFVPQRIVQDSASTAESSSTRLGFGIPTFGAGNKKDDGKEEEKPLEKKKIGLSGLVQLITAGAGSPFLGDFEGVDEETGNFMFSLEANNLVDENGQSKQTQAPYFESGWVSEEDQEKEKKKQEGGGFRFW
uniref:Uncharacterized protein n=1 Tax=Trieres chinensis TaxID=1514140 RepID=A0A7S1ZHV3_TRICV|mmetsp:Transcript_26042/g.53299  ORF Transcript_26042/g.53299 Transcript_26042/m.53299 type:complete len:152 (+) Transcript_26042:69-524(+)|eukprot:CAMPEP_0183299784 /NCGR_PEP_ID=MMETSP0160_2-20130417/6409_1 /TAXON_ID=2839 ORGANISM="Odontella Sinensis, Strain Grunow 1884" /NCGR_SAMPLE_ID=MMETSP0160_2 /ASSEMBLY_ACC=CAM_ASM_000250 /LENGTH=151 /DNA_ID=CAMNT_0025462087 /DNA_START=69 /DNA_END=524 /DNA_ORIENTATION=-